MTNRIIAFVSAMFAFGVTAHAQPLTTTHKVVPQAMSPADFGAAQPMPLPKASKAPAANGTAAGSLGESGVSPGSDGSGVTSPTTVPLSNQKAADFIEIPQEFGIAGQPYTTSWSNAQFNATFDYYPFRAAGRLFFKIGANTFVCSASLIKPGVVVTAAHCVANFGHSQFYSGWTFVPAYFNGSAPFGVWSAQSVTILSSYFNGSDPCAQSGVICQDDVALIVLTPHSGIFPGSATGWFGYGWGGYSFSNWMGNSQAIIAQLGYPVALDGGNRMERNDSQGFTVGELSNNTIIGSLMTGGSSGGPWLVNFGLAPALAGVSFGNSAAHNIVVGVTSWGYTNSTVKQQGAAPFTSGNIVVLVNAVCAAFKGAC